MTPSPGSQSEQQLESLGEPKLTLVSTQAPPLRSIKGQSLRMIPPHHHHHYFASRVEYFAEEDKGYKINRQYPKFGPAIPVLRGGV